MNIAIFRDGPFLPPLTGGAVSIYNLITELWRRGINVFLIKCYRKEDDYHLYAKEEFPTLFLKEKNYYLNIDPLVDFLKKNKIKIIHFDSAEAVNWQGNLIKFHIPHIKIVWEVHNVNHVLFSRLKEKIGKINLAIKQEKEALTSADLILVRSKIDKYALLSIGGKENKIKIYKGGIKIGKQIKRSFPCKEKRDIIFIGNLFYSPNHEAVKIIDKIAIKMLNYNFKILGPVDKNLITSIKSPNIKFLGPIKNPYKFYLTSFVGIAPLISGSGTRIKILEYLNAGLPTITTNLGIEGLDRRIKKVLIIEDNFEKYPITIEKLANNPGKWVSFSRKGQRFVKKLYNWEKNVETIIKAYRQLIKPLKNEKKNYRATIK